MKAVVVEQYDTIDKIPLKDVALPDVGDGQVRVKVQAASIGFVDGLKVQGLYQTKDALPFTPGTEFAGLVDAVGSGVTGLAPGQAVMGMARSGALAEFIAVPAATLTATPDGIAPEVAAAFRANYLTALYALAERGSLKPGEFLLVLGAAGGVGIAAVQIGKLLGARVIAAASSPDKLEVCRAHGADLLLDYTKTDLKDGLRELTGGRGADVVYDCVGGPYSEPAVRAMAWQGRFLVVGFAAGEIPRLPLNLLLLKGCDAVGVFWGESVKRDPAGHRANMVKVLDWVAAGRLAPHLHATYPLDRIADAVRVLDGRAATGKVVVLL